MKIVCDCGVELLTTTDAVDSEYGVVVVVGIDDKTTGVCTSPLEPKSDMYHIGVKNPPDNDSVFSVSCSCGRNLLNVSRNHVKDTK